MDHFAPGSIGPRSTIKSSISGIAPPSPAAPGASVEAGCQVRQFATAFACIDASAAEIVIGSLAAQALEARRFDDATFWQRVKLHSRMVRAVPGWPDRIATPVVDG